MMTALLQEARARDSLGGRQVYPDFFRQVISRRDRWLRLAR
jgi:hypothetical protein